MDFSVQLPLLAEKTVTTPASSLAAQPGKTNLPDEINQAPFEQALDKAAKNSTRKIHRSASAGIEGDPNQAALAFANIPTPPAVLLLLDAPVEASTSALLVQASGAAQLSNLIMTGGAGHLTVLPTDSTTKPAGSLVLPAAFQQAIELAQTAAGQLLQVEGVNLVSQVEAPPVPGGHAAAAGPVATQPLTPADMPVGGMANAMAGEPTRAFQSQVILGLVTEPATPVLPNPPGNDPASPKIPQPPTVNGGLVDTGPAPLARAGVDAEPGKEAVSGYPERAVLVEPATDPPGKQVAAPVGDLAADPSAETATIGAPPPVHIKIHEPARLAEAHQIEVFDQLSENVERLHSTGKTGLHLQLHPQELGRIDLRIANRADGLHVLISASQVETGAMLERSLEQLRHTLSQAGLELAQVSVSAGGSGGQSYGAWQGAAHHPGAPARAGRGLLVKEQPPTEKAASSRFTTSQIDIHV